MRIFQRSLLAGAIAVGLTASGTASAQFSGAYIFGDSLSDGGQYKPGYRYTTNPGLTIPEYVNQSFGMTTTTSFTGGTNYGQSGALMNTPQGDVPPGLPDLSVVAQVNTLLAKGPLDPNALYQVQGGGNDILLQLQRYVGGTITQAQLQAAVAQAAVDLATTAGKLQAAGAKYIVVQWMGDAGMAPEVAPFGPAGVAAATQLASLYNMTLNQAILQAGVKVIPFNVFAFMQEARANPGAFGLANVTGVACTTPTGNTCTSATLVAPNANMTYMFADGHHGATGFYSAVASAIASVIVAPQQMGALAEAPLAVEQASWRAVDGRMVSGINAPRSQGKFDAWASYDYGNPDVDTGHQSGSGDVNTISVGGDIKMSDRLLVGAMFNYSENKTEVGSLDFKLKEPMGTVYVGYGEGPWYIGATLGAGGLDYSTTRDIALNGVTRQETGNTSGWQYVGRLMGGYWFQYANWVHGPTAKLTYQEIRVRQFQENGSNSTTMTFDQQERKSFVTSLGWQVAGNLSGIRPFARASWEYEGQSDDRTVTASVYGMPGSFDMPTSKPDNNWGLFNLGAATEFGKVTGYITGSATAGKSDGDYWAITVGLRAPL
jgi:outer membrane lipase/esterase